MDSGAEAVKRAGEWGQVSVMNIYKEPTLFMTHI